MHTEWKPKDSTMETSGNGWVVYETMQIVSAAFVILLTIYNQKHLDNENWPLM